MNSHYNTTNYNQCSSYNLIHPLHTMVPMANNYIPYPAPISSCPPSQPLPSSFNPKLLLSPNVHSVQKRKAVDGPLERSSSSPLSTSSYSSTTSFPEANLPLKKSKSTPIPVKKALSKQQKIVEEEIESPEEEAKSRQRSLERNRLAASKCRQRKKEWIEELAHKAERMSCENEHLKQLLLQLKEETLFLKTQLMIHKGYAGNLCKNKEYFNML